MSNRRAEHGRLEAALPALKLRASVLRAIRCFFNDRGFVEVETPVRLPAPALELHIDAIPSGREFLRTSPELHMKRLVAAGLGKIYQVGPCFRMGERGRLHNPEFTMVEWYRVDSDFHDVLVDVKALLISVARDVLGSVVVRFGGCDIDMAGEWVYRTVADAFGEYAGWNPVAMFDEDRFDIDLVEKVEPGLPRDRPVVLAEYPVEAGALARRSPGDHRVAERWELYVGGIELANAFSELTDEVEQRRRFEQCAAARKARGRPVYPIDEDFLDAMRGMPPCAGVALGVDRLVMILAGLDSLDAALPFREPAGGQG